MTWRLAKALTTLQAEVNQLHPDRPKQSDGTIGDARHQAEVSDHNPNSAGVVTAWDITTAPFTDALAETFRRMGAGGDRRVKYVIYKARIASNVDSWAWRPYSGFSPHYDHVHLSVSADPAQYDRTDPWLTPPKPAPATVTAHTITPPQPLEAPVLFLAYHSDHTHYIVEMTVHGCLKRAIGPAEERLYHAGGVQAASPALTDAQITAIPAAGAAR